MAWAPEADRAPKMTAAESASPVKKRAQVEVKVASSFSFLSYLLVVSALRKVR
jgi:DNA polymerase III alpha subunit